MPPADRSARGAERSSTALTWNVEHVVAGQCAPCVAIAERARRRARARAQRAPDVTPVIMAGGRARSSRRRASDARRPSASLRWAPASSTDWPLRRIDYLLVRGLDVGEFRVLDQTLSDHRAITVKDRLDGPRLDRSNGSGDRDRQVQQVAAVPEARVHDTRPGSVHHPFKGPEHCAPLN